MDTIQPINAMESFPIFREVGVTVSMILQQRFVGPQRDYRLPEVRVFHSIPPSKFPFLLKYTEQCD
jgi:hypothetical protein